MSNAFPLLRLLHRWMTLLQVVSATTMYATFLLNASTVHTEQYQAMYKVLMAFALLNAIIGTLSVVYHPTPHLNLLSSYLRWPNDNVGLLQKSQRRSAHVVLPDNSLRVVRQILQC